MHSGVIAHRISASCRDEQASGLCSPETRDRTFLSFRAESRNLLVMKLRNVLALALSIFALSARAEKTAEPAPFGSAAILSEQAPSLSKASE
jgi:hypothetical protein